MDLFLQMPPSMLSLCERSNFDQSIQLFYKTWFCWYVFKIWH